MRKLLFFLILGAILFPVVAMADTIPISVPESSEITTTDTVPLAGVDANGEVLVEKANNMANSLHQLVMKLSIPLVVVVVILGVVLGIFIEAARKVALFAVIALVIVYWAPMLISMVVNWIQ